MDVLIADIDMPGMKGMDLAQQATERWPHLRVLLVSGGAADVGRVRATGVYQITQLLPSEEDTFRYRIKNPNEPHERVVLELLHSAHPVELPAEWARQMLAGAHVMGIRLPCPEPRWRNHVVAIPILAPFHRRQERS